jgi:DNA mismatch repair protein MutS2
MVYPENIEYKLGFDLVRELLKKECLSTLGQAYVDKIRFSSDVDLIRKLIEQTAEFKSIFSSGLSFPSQNYIDAVPYLSKLRAEGSFLNPEEFGEIKISLFTISSCLDFFDAQPEGTFPVLKALRSEISLDKNIFRTIDKVIDDKGAIRDNASSELQDIRRNIVSQQSRIRKELDRILRLVKKDGYSDEDVSVTIRSGRMVIPVNAEHKRKVKGFVHDESATGQTVFIEPAEVLDINNEIRELEYQERREIIRILTSLSDYVRPSIPEVKKAYTFLGLIDFIRAKAKLAIQMEAGKPLIENTQVLNWINGRHPLLFLSFKKQNKKVVPLNIHLDRERRILIISGPNAGGKSVCLKTTGLVQYMFQSGLLVPVDEHSTLGIFQDIFIDIGDEQSIENDLSTYSSHLKNMKHFLTFASNKSLMLIDEFGTGTEPQFGAAIAESVLEHLNQKKVFGIITTHYSNLKAFAEHTEGVINGAMRFDLSRLEPLYELEIGKPGSSFAFEIAGKIGLPKEVIESSKAKLGNTQVDFDKLLNELEAEKVKMKKENASHELKSKELEKTLSEYNELKDYLEVHKKKLLSEAKQQAKQLLRDANQKIENTIRQIKESKAEKELTKELREELGNFKESLEPEERVEPAAKHEVIPGEIKIGDLVRVKDNGALGEVLSLKGKDAEIMIGELKSNIKLSRLEKISRKEYREYVGEENLPSGRGIHYNEKLGNFSPHIDLRGKRGEEAVKEVQELIDSAIIFGVQEIRIVHGKGDGILRTLIRNLLKNYKQVQSMADDHADRGGAGVTLVKLK